MFSDCLGNRYVPSPSGSVGSRQNPSKFAWVTAWVRDSRGSSRGSDATPSSRELPPDEVAGRMFGMVHGLPLTDFRAHRSVLDPDDFAGGDDLPDPPPSDLIDLDTWRGIVGLPDDVSVRTSNRHGGRLRVKHEILGVRLHALPEPEDLDFDRPLDPAYARCGRLTSGGDLRAAEWSSRIRVASVRPGRTRADSGRWLTQMR